MPQFFIKFKTCITTKGLCSSVVGGVLLTLILCIFVTGCRSTDKSVTSSLPSKHSVRSDQLLVMSDFRIPRKHELIEELISLRKEVTSTLHLPAQNEEVVVYLFQNEAEYRSYLNSIYPGLPPRRAYFVGTSTELAVYTFWGDRIQEDLRHEYTHGLLHTSLMHVPLWLDEGLAEYFEVPQGSRNINYDHASKLPQRLADGWRPDLKRLEALEEFAQMKRTDYQESWAWVHFMLQTSPTSQEALLSYLQDLRDNKTPPPISKRLSQNVPQVQQRIASHMAAFTVGR